MAKTHSGANGGGAPASSSKLNGRGDQSHETNSQGWKHVVEETAKGAHESTRRQSERPKRDTINAVGPTPLRARASKRRTYEVRSSDGPYVGERSRTPVSVDRRRAEPRPIPDEVKQRFVQVGNKYHFPDGARAFTDHGNRLTSPSENTEVIRSLISIAQARGWSDITVSGTERFRKEAWFAARAAGLDVRGYTPTDLDQGRLVRTLAREQSRDEHVGSGASRVSSASSSSDRLNANSVRDAETPQLSRERQRKLQVGRIASPLVV